MGNEKSPKRCFSAQNQMLGEWAGLWSDISGSGFLNILHMRMTLVQPSKYHNPSNIEQMRMGYASTVALPSCNIRALRYKAIATMNGTRGWD
jgi:hypothetical protein